MVREGCGVRVIGGDLESEGRDGWRSEGRGGRRWDVGELERKQKGFDL